MHTAATILTVAVPLLYIARNRKNRMLRGYPIFIAMIATLALSATGWTLGALEGFTRPAVTTAIAGSVPLVQLLLLLAALRLFMSKVDHRRQATHYRPPFWLQIARKAQEPSLCHFC